MEKVLIGVIPLVDYEKESYWMLPGYMKGIEEAGGLPIMLPLTNDDECLEQIADTVDGVLFTGGHDVAPEVYGAEKSPFCGETCSERDEMEKILFNKLVERDKAIFGICRGIQLFNALLGGSLYQDLPAEHPSSLEHHQAPPYNEPVHEVEILENTPLYKLLNKKLLQVNSYHHQAIKELAPTLLPMAYAADGLTEAVYMPNKSFAWALQWHPEFSHLTDEDSRKIFAAFVEAAKN